MQEWNPLWLFGTKSFQRMSVTRQLVEKRGIYRLPDCLFFETQVRCSNGILLPKLFSPTVRKNCSSDREPLLLKFEAEGQTFAKFLRPFEQFIQTVKGQNNFW